MTVCISEGAKKKIEDISDPTQITKANRCAKTSVTSQIVINMPTRELLTGETKNSFVFTCKTF